MRKRKLFAWLLAVAAVAAHYKFDPWGFYWKVSPEEAASRMKLITVAQTHLGRNEADGSHQAILDRYNTQETLPRGYTVQPEDSWCATFVTAASMEAGLADLIPPECGCERQIGLWQELGRWEEDDNAVPLPGFFSSRYRDDRHALACIAALVILIFFHCTKCFVHCRHN